MLTSSTQAKNQGFYIKKNPLETSASMKALHKKPLVDPKPGF
jgi:hypothetical protein